MPKPKDRPHLPPGWQFDPDPMPDNNMHTSDTPERVHIPYIQLPDDAIPLIPLSSVIIAYLAARQINAFLRSL
jgi:hypothetical protein